MSHELRALLNGVIGMTGLLLASELAPGQRRQAEVVNTSAESLLGPIGEILAERWAGSVRRELLDHVVVLGDRHLRQLLAEYVAFYQDDRPHLGLAKDTPQGRATASRPTPDASLIAGPRVGALHHRYTWQAANLGSSPARRSR